MIMPTQDDEPIKSSASNKDDEPICEIAKKSVFKTLPIQGRAYKLHRNFVL